MTASVRPSVRPASHKISGRAADLASGLISLFFVFYYRLGIFLRTFFYFCQFWLLSPILGGLRGPFYDIFSKILGADWRMPGWSELLFFCVLLQVRDISTDVFFIFANFGF